MFGSTTYHNRDVCVVEWQSFLRFLIVWMLPRCSYQMSHVSGLDAGLSARHSLPSSALQGPLHMHSYFRYNVVVEVILTRDTTNTAVQTHNMSPLYSSSRHRQWPTSPAPQPLILSLIRFPRGIQLMQPSILIIVTLIVRDSDLKVGVDDARRRTHPLPHHHLLVLALELVGLSVISHSSALSKYEKYNLQCS